MRIDPSGMGMAGMAKKDVRRALDDGLASGFSMLTTTKALRRGGVKNMVVAVPTAPVSAIKRARHLLDLRLFNRCLNTLLLEVVFYVEE